MAVMKDGVMTGRLTKEQEEQEGQELQVAWDAGGKRAFELRGIDEEYGEALVYDRVRVENEARFYMGQSAMAMFELGRRLILLKEHEAHGEFLKSLERVGISRSTAVRTMQASAKISRLPNVATLQHLTPSKIYELITLDDDTLKELNEGGTIAGLGLDAIDKMTTRELRDEVRRLKASRLEETESHEQLLSDKNRKLDDMSRHMNMITKPEGWHVLANELNASVTDAWSTASEGLEGLWAVYSRLVNEGRGEHKDNLEKALPLVILHLQWHAQIAMESAERLVDMIRHRLPMPWHPINMSTEEVALDTKAEHLIEARETAERIIPAFSEEEEEA